MSKYANRTGINRPGRGPAHDSEVPTPGFYRIRQGRGTVPSAVRIWLGPIIDPDTGETMLERGERWQASINGHPADLARVWPDCARDPIPEQEHDRLCAAHRSMDPKSVFYDPLKPIDRLTAPLPF